jgi:hypothetical protein
LACINYTPCANRAKLTPQRPIFSTLHDIRVERISNSERTKLLRDVENTFI